MIVILALHVEREKAQGLMSDLAARGLNVSLIQAQEQLIIDAVGLPDHIAHGLAKKLRADSRVADVIVRGTPYPRIAGSKTVPVGIGELLVGGSEVVLMAGPCTIESEEQIHSAAQGVSQSGATVLRGGAYKPSTSPYGFRGHGSVALRWMAEAARAHHLKTVSEVMDPRLVEEVAAVIDVLQIGARNMQNFDLLREVGRTNKPVLLKRGLSARLEEWLLAAEHIANEGNERIILCERGIRSFDTFTRNTLDIAAVAAAKHLTHLPIVVDPSHAAGRRDLIAPLSLAAIAAGADGLLIEVHPIPEQAEKDGAQSLSLEEFRSLTPGIVQVAAAVGRPVSGQAVPAKAI